MMVGLSRGNDGVVEVRELVEAENTREASARARRFLIDPQVILETIREARANGLDIVGYYHSHPDHPAVPSDFDREHAWPATSYLIVSVRGGEDAEMKSWRLRDDRSSYEEEAVVAEVSTLESSDSSRATQNEETNA